MLKIHGRIAIGMVSSVGSSLGVATGLVVCISGGVNSIISPVSTTWTV